MIVRLLVPPALALALALALPLALAPARADQWHVTPVATQLPGDAANGPSSNVRLNRLDGRYALFSSLATNLVLGQSDTNAVRDVFVRDRVTGTTQLVSGALGSTTETADAASLPHAISDDGRWIVFTSFASNLVAGVTGGTVGENRLYLFDRETGAMTLVSHRFDSESTAATGRIGQVTISGNGAWVVYVSSATDLIDGISSASDIYQYDRLAGTNSLVSRSAGSATTGGNGDSRTPLISSDGRWIAFDSNASNLVGSDGNGKIDVFLYDRFARPSLRLVSKQFGTIATSANGASTLDALTPDGRWVLFGSSATNLLTGVTDNASHSDVFVYDRGTGETILASRPAGSTTTTPNDLSLARGISDDGARIIFQSFATDLGFSNGNKSTQAYMFDRTTLATTLVSRERGTTTIPAAGFANPGAISADGQTIAFASSGDNLVAGIHDVNATPDLFLFTVASGTTTLVSRAGSAARTAAGRSGGSGLANDLSLANGWLAFSSDAHDLIDGVDDTNGTTDVFVRDPATGDIQLLSAGIGTPQTTLGKGSSAVSMSGDGRWITFSTTDPSVVPGTADSNLVRDAFVHDRELSITSLVSAATGMPSTTANAASAPVGTSADGRWVLYASSATDAVAGQVDGNGENDAFLLDRTSGISQLVSRSFGGTASTANGVTEPVAVSPDGRYALFNSTSTDLVEGISDSTGTNDVFVFDRDTGTMTLVSRTADGTATLDGYSFAAAMSTDGRWILYTFEHETGRDAYLFDRDTLSTILVSHLPDSPSQSAGAFSTARFLSADGQWALFVSSSSRLMANGSDTNAGSDVFLFERDTGKVTLVSHAFGFTSTAANGTSFPTGLSADGRWVLFRSSASNLSSGVIDANGPLNDVYLFDRTTLTNTLVTRAAGTSNTTPDAEARSSLISSDGRWVAFSTFASNIADDGANDELDTFVWDRVTGTTTLASRAPPPGDASNGPTAPIAISADGRWLLLLSGASNLVDIEDFAGQHDVYVAEHLLDVVATAGPNGSVTPAGTRSVPLGTSVQFTVTPASHYGVQSVVGCGGSLAGTTYTTAAIFADCTVTASFGNAAPTIGSVADVTVLEDSALRTITVTVADAESPASALVLSASSAQPSIVPAPTVGAGATGGQRTVSFAPAANRNGGPVAITLTLTDVPGATRQRTFDVTVTAVNDAPTLVFATSPRHAAGTSGAQSIPGFADVDFGPPDEDAGQDVEDFQIHGIADPAGILVPGSLDIANSGTLVYTLTGLAGRATVQVSVRDNGGTQNGGLNTSAVGSFSVTVAGPVIFANGFE